MTTQEMYNNIELRLQKGGTFAFDNFQPEELDIVLNEAQLRLIKSRINLRSDLKKAGFAKNQKRLNDVRILIKPLSVSGKGPDYVLPEDFFVELEAAMECCIGTTQFRKPVRIVENDRTEEDSANPFRRPTDSSFTAYISGNILTVNAQEKYILLTLKGQYIRIPKKINLSSNCELPEVIHGEIVDLAVSQLLEILESRRYQSSKIEASQSE